MPFRTFIYGQPLSGGHRITGGRWGETNGGQAWIVDLPEVKEGKWRFRQLFVNGQRRPRTRLPKQGEYRIESLPGYTGDFLRSPTKQFVYAAGHIVPTWRNLRDVEVVGITRWLDNRLPIESINGATRTVTFDRPSLFALVSSALWGDSTNTPSVYWVENVFEAMETAGQWYLDRPRGLLYYLPQPGEDPAAAEIIAPRLTQVVRVVGRPGATAHDIRFEGIAFSHTEWQPPPDYASSLQAGVEVPGALFFDYAERCAVTGGRIEHIGNCGVEVNVGCTDIEISRNEITDIGAGGIRVGHFFSWETDGSGQLTERGRQRKAAMPKGAHSRRITISDNVIAHCGRFTPEAAGVFVGDNAENHVIHNHIYDLFQCGISVGSVQDFGPNHAQGNIVEHNHVHDVGQGMLSDLAGIYTCSTPGTRIRYNVVHDISRRDYGGWGIYPDQGAHDLLIQKNLVYRCQDGALFAHHNRNITADNNIFAFSRQVLVERYGIGGFELTCRRNLFYYREGNAIGSGGIANSGTNVCVFDHNLYWNASGQPVLFGDKTLAQWQAAGQDKNSMIADPLFVDPKKGDFRLRPGSPAAKIGFEPWDLSVVGPRPRPTRLASAVETTGPLRVHPANRRYFTDGSGKLIYLTGSHHWDNFQRWFEGEPGAPSGPAGRLGDFDSYLNMLEAHGHNFVRLWVADTAWSPITKAAIEPQPFVRTGPGKAANGGLKFDLNRLNQAYFDELRTGVLAARRRGIYVGVMLFNGWGVGVYQSRPHNITWDYHPFNKANNIHGIDGDPNGDRRGVECHSLQLPAVTKLQETYVRKVLDTVHDLDNVLYEISNESGPTSAKWQCHLIRHIKDYEAAKPKHHP